MKLNKIVAVCVANGFRSPAIEVCTRSALDNIGVYDIDVIGRGVKADYVTNAVAGMGDLAEKDIDGAINRLIRIPSNYSENLVLLLGQKIENAELARHIFNEERKDYCNIIERYCDENGWEYPKSYHQQLLKEDLDEKTHIIVASVPEKESIGLIKPFSEERITVLGIEDTLGGTYKDKKPVLDEIRFKVEDVINELYS